jgi:pilus assembly protein CpaC
VASATQTLNGFTGLGSNSTAFGVFSSGDVALVMRALRENSLLTVLAEPNLIALSGQRASFLAGGQFPVPVPQGAGGVNNQVTVQFKDFGVSLDFTPYVLDDKTIRLQVSPEVSSIDEALGTTLVVGGDPVPGLSTRRVDTTVELAQGTTLALAGLLQMQVDARSSRLPGIGDVPYLGPFFSKNSQRKVEKELLVLVTPYLVHPMTPDQVPPLPGSEIVPPSDKEFYWLNRIEGLPTMPGPAPANGSRVTLPVTSEGIPTPAPTPIGDSLSLVERMKLEQRSLMVPVGLSE